MVAGVASDCIKASTEETAANLGLPKTGAKTETQKFNNYDLNF